jgi:hypothetical protein
MTHGDHGGPVTVTAGRALHCSDSARKPPREKFSGLLRLSADSESAGFKLYYDKG